MCRMLIALGDINTSHLVDGIIAMASDKNANHEYNKDIQGSFVHGCGWSFATLDINNDWLIRKSTEPIFTDEAVWDLKPVNSKLRSFHARKATKGGITMNNLHHFYYESPEFGSFVMSHNGHIYDELSFNDKFVVKGETDSEKFFYHLVSRIENGLDIPKALSLSLKNLEDFRGANIIFSTKEKSYITVFHTSRPKYYEMNLVKKGNSLVVSSEVIQLPGVEDVDWISIKNNDLVEIDHEKLTYEIKKI